MTTLAARAPTDALALATENAGLRARLHAQAETIRQLKQQLDWFKKQLFGPKSEKQAFDLPGQASLFEAREAPLPEAPPEAEPPTPARRGSGRKRRAEDCLNDSGLRFGADVPVEVVEVLPPELQGPEADRYEILAIKTRYRLAQRAASYVVLRYDHPVFRRKGDDTPITTPAPIHVLERSLADVSLLAGLLVDKFRDHLPLYRQHQRLQQAGIALSRSTLTNWVQRAIELLKPIVDAQTRSVLQSRVLAMDETPIKVGRARSGHQGRAGPLPGRMKTGWFWPLYGDADEVVFTYSDSRGRAHIEHVLKERFSGTLISDGYAAYARYAQQRAEVTHAQCWVHGRRPFIEAQKEHPERAAQALQWIARLYRVEAEIRARGLAGDEKRRYRLAQAGPAVDDFFAWCREQPNQGGLLPQDPLSKALNYVLRREASLRVFLEDPAVPLDTNHLERALRPIPQGRKNWMFCWTELGAEHVGIIQSLITTCKLHGVDPYTYLVDVLQRVGRHPAREVAELTPRRWKARFADQPLRSDLYWADARRAGERPALGARPCASKI